MNLRQIRVKDQTELKRVYFDSINSIKGDIYTREQKIAWSSQAWENPFFKKALIEGKGWVIEQIDENEIKAFATRYPRGKLALLYCRGESRGLGMGTALLNKIEEDAKKEGLKELKTEASLISYKLLLRMDWEIIRKERIIIRDTYFERYNMIKIFDKLTK